MLAVWHHSLQLALAMEGAPLPPTLPQNPSLCWCFHVFGGPGPERRASGSRFLTVLELFFDDFWLLTGSKNIVKYSVFIVFVYGNYILQQGENCVNTSVFAWPRAKNTVNTAIFATKGKKHRKYRGFPLPTCKNHRYLQRFLLQGFQKYAKTPPK